LPEDAAALRDVAGNADRDVFAFRLLRYNFFSTGGFYTTREAKLFRSQPDIRYRRRINESVTGAILDSGGRIEPAPVILNHFGHTRSLEVREAKAHFYLDLMARQLVERPDDAVLHGYTGLILRTLGRFDEALVASERALSVDSSSPLPWFFRGHVLRSVGDDPAALSAYREAVDRSPLDAAIWNMAGVMELSLGQLGEASTTFAHARELDPLLVHVMINQGLVEQAQGRWRGAVELFERAARRNPAFLHEDWNGRAERDPFREFYYETIMQYAGLAYHIAYCRLRALGELSETDSARAVLSENTSSTS
jgi:tetratricopeptide (TPR) repeat protein